MIIFLSAVSPIICSHLSFKIFFHPCVCLHFNKVCVSHSFLHYVRGIFPFSASIFYTCHFPVTQLKICSPIPLIHNATDYIHFPSPLLFPVPIWDCRSLVSNFFVCFLSLNTITPNFHYFTYFKSLPSLCNQKYPSPFFYSASLRIITQLSHFRSAICHALEGFLTICDWKMAKELKEGLRQKLILTEHTGEELK